MITLTDDNIDAFWDSISKAKTTFSVDLMAANPDIQAEVLSGTFDVSVFKLYFEGTDTFVALVDDGGDDGSYDWAKFADTEAEARSLANDFIIEWKRAWDLPII